MSVSSADTLEIQNYLCKCEVIINARYSFTLCNGHNISLQDNIPSTLSGLPPRRGKRAKRALGALRTFARILYSVGVGLPPGKRAFSQTLTLIYDSIVEKGEDLK